MVRVTRTEMVYDGYSGKYLTMTKAQKKKPKLSFHSTEEYDWDEEFEMTTGKSKQQDDKVCNVYEEIIVFFYVRFTGPELAC